MRISFGRFTTTLAVSAFAVLAGCQSAPSDLETTSDELRVRGCIRPFIACVRGASSSEEVDLCRDQLRSCIESQLRPDDREDDAGVGEPPPPDDGDAGEPSDPGDPADPGDPTDPGDPAPGGEVTACITSLTVDDLTRSVSCRTNATGTSCNCFDGRDATRCTQETADCSFETSCCAGEL
ncbi:hypothetical protein [Sandaracinus amylolyticus]|nr:hypothetical protein [Sandaracinus amylolyticus]